MGRQARLVQQPMNVNCLKIQVIFFFFAHVIKKTLPQSASTIKLNLKVCRVSPCRDERRGWVFVRPSGHVVNGSSSQRTITSTILRCAFFSSLFSCQGLPSVCIYLHSCRRAPSEASLRRPGSHWCVCVRLSKGSLVLLFNPPSFCLMSTLNLLTSLRSV